jgi:hypothetical protein
MATGRRLLSRIRERGIFFKSNAECRAAQLIYQHMHEAGDGSDRGRTFLSVLFLVIVRDVQDGEPRKVILFYSFFLILEKFDVQDGTERKGESAP